MKIQFAGNRKICFSSSGELFDFLRRPDIRFVAFPEITAAEIEIDSGLASYLGDAVHRGSLKDTRAAILLEGLKKEDVPSLREKLRQLDEAKASQEKATA